MIGSWRWNAALGLLGAALTLLFSLGGNGLEISCIRSLYAFAAFYIVGFLFRAAVTAIMKPRPASPADMPDDSAPEGTAGRQVDLTTPDESEQLHEMLKDRMEPNGGPAADGQSAFKPLTPAKLVSTPDKDPEQLAKAIRHLTGG